MFGGKGFSFGGTPTTSSSAGTTPGFSFGAQTATASPSTGFTLGGTPAAGTGQPGGFKLGTTPASGTATTGFNFGATSTPATATSTAAPGFGGFSQPTPGGFGLAATSAPTSTPATGLTGFGALGGTSTPATSFSLGGTGTAAPPSTGNSVLTGLLGTPKTTASTTPGLGLGVAPQATTTTASAFTGFKVGGTPASTATAGGFSFSKPGTAGTTSTTTAAPVAAGGFGFGAKVTTTSNTATSSVPAAAGGFNFGGTATSTATTTATGTSIGTGLASTVPGTQMTYRQLEDQINKWMGELESQEKVFLQQATQVNAWDRLLVDNGEKITQLNGDMERVKLDQGKLEQELEFIKSQQRELEDLIIPLEKSMEQLPSSSLQPHHADLERENTYQLADNIDAQLKRMVQDLKEIIDHLNMSSSGQDTNDPILQITKILNEHMDSLQWVDNNSALLGRRVEDISKQMENQKKDQERNFRLVYD